jgi:hypothetical protein
MDNKYIKIFILFISLFVLSGCVNVKKDSIESITQYITGNQRKLYNNFNKGYKYYIPKGLSASEIDDLNVKIKSQRYNYYLYVDLVSYYNKVKLTYNIDKSLYYSKHIGDGEGLINITKLADNYLINIQYNYARIEVKVNESDLKDALSNALIIVNSIKYNDETIRAMLDEGLLSVNEKVVQVFDESKSQSDLLEITEDEYYEDDNNYDNDYIN